MLCKCAQSSSMNFFKYCSLERENKVVAQGNPPKLWGCSDHVLKQNWKGTPCLNIFWIYCRQCGLEGKDVVFTTSLIAWSGFNPRPGHVVASLEKTLYDCCLCLQLQLDFIHQVALTRRQRRGLSVFESSCHLPTCLPHTAKASHYPFNCWTSSRKAVNPNIYSLWFDPTQLGGFEQVAN